MKPLQNVTVYEKQQISLECELSKPNGDAVWQKDGVDVKYSLGLDRYSKKVDGNVYKLVVYEAQLEDTANFACSLKQTKTTCEVKVLEKPVEVIKPLEDEEVVENQKATFVCVLSKPRLKVAWYKDGEKLKEGGRIQFAQEGKVYKLIIDGARPEDKGSYKIKFEDTESAADLHVKGTFSGLVLVSDDFSRKKTLKLI
jgi:hypothetical protein